MHRTINTSFGTKVYLIFFAFLGVATALYAWARNWIEGDIVTFFDSLISTFVGALISILVGIYLVRRRGDEQRREETKRLNLIVSGETATIKNELRGANPNFTYALSKGKLIDTTATWIPWSCHEEAASSGVFDADTTNQLIAVVQKIRAYNLTASNLLNCASKIVPSNEHTYLDQNLLSAYRNVEGAIEKVLKALETVQS